MAINLKSAASQSQDGGNAEVIGHPVVRTMRMMMFGTSDNAQWAADRNLRAQGIPLREMQVMVDRKGFQYVVGQPIRLTYAKRGIVDVVFRIMNIKESTATSEHVGLQLLEDFDYISSSVANIDVDRDGSAVDYSLLTLTDIKIIEMPYSMAGEEIQIIPLVGRKVGNETGFEFYHSFDGLTYGLKANITSYMPYGLTQVAFPARIPSSSKTFKLTIQFDLPADAAGIDTIARAFAVGGAENLGVLCNGGTTEIITFDTITPTTNGATGEYDITRFFRGRFDTPKVDWPAGSEFYFIGESGAGVTDTNYLHGTNRYYKLVPYNVKSVGDLGDAIPVTHVFTSRAFRPYIPGNFTMDGVGGGTTIQPTFTFSGSDSAELFKLWWSPRIRGEAAGLGNPDELTDAYPTVEGFFEIYVYNGATLAATELSASGFSFSYTEEDIRTAVGFTPEKLTIKLRNSILTSGTVYRSDYTVLNATGG